MMQMRSTTRSLAVVLFACAMLASPLTAQRPGGDAVRSASVLRGTVFDSLITGKLLVDAEVYVDGVLQVRRTDSRGRFQFDSLPAGRYSVGFTHPVIDSLGLSAPTRTIDLAAGAAVTTVLTTPSAATLHAHACGRPLPEKAGLVLGVVRDADGDSAIAGVTVSAHWTALVLERGVRPVQAEQVSQAATDGAGRYVLCGVPDDVPIVLRTAVGGVAAGAVELEPAAHAVALRNLSVSLGDVRSGGAPSVAAGADATPADSLRRGTAKLNGRVRDERGNAVTDAEVRVLGAATPKVTSSTDGSFTLTGLPGGSQIVEVRALGFAPYRGSADLKRDVATTQDVRLSKVAVVLTPLSVTGYSPLFDQSGFDKRRQAGLGRYITEDQIRARNPTRIEDVFRGEPSVTLLPVGLGGYAMVFTRAQGGRFCYPNYFVDGALYRSDPNQNNAGLPMLPQDIRGIELYPNAATTPPQFSTLDGSCGTVVVWTKRGAAITNTR